MFRIRPLVLVAALAAGAVVFGLAPAAYADPADQTVAFTSAPPTPALYGGSYVPTASASSGLPVGITVDPSTSGNCTSDGTTVTFVHVGSCKLIANQPGNDDFNPASAQQTFTINQAQLTVSTFAVQTYGDASTIYVFDTDNVVGLQFDDTPSVLTGTLSCSSPVTATTGVGAYGITGCSGLSATNYNVNYTVGSVTVKPAQLLVTASNAAFTYGHSVPAINPIYSGFKNGETAAVLTSLPTCSTTATSSSNVGSYVSSCTGGSAANYQINYGTGAVLVTRASLIITASNGSFQYGHSVPSVTPSYSGFQGSDGPGSLTTPPTCTTTATSHSPIGTYTSFRSGAVSGNYSIAYVSGSMTVTKAALTITASSASVGFGDDIPAITPTYSGFVNGEDQFDLITQPTCSTTATSTSPAGDYPTTCSGASASNYTITYQSGTLSVVKAILTVTASSATIFYGGSPPAITPFYDGFLNGDSPATLTTQPTCSTTVTSSTTVGSYQSTCSGGSSANYTLVFAHGTITVKKAPLTVIAGDVTRPMGGANAFSYSFLGFVNGDGAAAVTGQPAFSTSANATSEPGMYLITPSAGTLAAANYSFLFQNGWLTVTKGTLHLTVAPASKALMLKNHKMTFSATATNNLSGLPVAGITLTWKVPVALGGTVTCSGVTNAAGTASCTSTDGRLLLLGVGKPYTVNFAGNFDYLPASAPGTITA
jgi:hypothetical protein